MGSASEWRFIIHAIALSDIPFLIKFNRSVWCTLKMLVRLINSWTVSCTVSAVVRSWLIIVFLLKPIALYKRTAMRSACLCRYAYMWLPFTTKPYGLFPYHIAALSPVISTETITSLSAVNDQLNIATLDNTLVDARLKLGNGAEDHIVFCSRRGICGIRWWAWRMWS